MSTLAQLIKKLIAADQYLIGQHAAERLQERDILEWQVIAGMAAARTVGERRLPPHATAEFEVMLPDGSLVLAVWAHLIASKRVKLVIVYFLTGG